MVSVGIEYLLNHVVSTKFVIDINPLSSYFVILNHPVTGYIMVMSFIFKFYLLPFIIMK